MDSFENPRSKRHIHRLLLHWTRRQHALWRLLNPQPSEERDSRLSSTFLYDLPLWASTMSELEIQSSKPTARNRL